MSANKRGKLKAKTRAPTPNPTLVHVPVDVYKQVLTELGMYTGTGPCTDRHPSVM